MDARITARFGDAARLLGDTNVTFVEHGPFAWLETVAVLAFDVRALFLDGVGSAQKWVAMPRDIEAFRFVIARVRPPLRDWQPIVAAHSALTADSALLTRAEVDALADPRWYLMPIGQKALDAWHAPRVVDGDVLEWFVERFPHRAEIAHVTVDAQYRVVVA